jgi:3-hydroxyisobutyrate dehydrogenase
MKQIGIVGVGVMGRGMVSNYLKNGYDVYIWNRTLDKIKSLVDQGAVLCTSPSEVAKKSDIIFEVTASDETSRAAWMGEVGILKEIKSGKICVCSATISARWVDELAKLCESNGVRFLDIPLTGGRVGAEMGELVLLAGGDENTIDEIKKELAVISARIKHFGPAGSGARYKLILNTLQAIHTGAFYEMLNIAKRVNLNVETVAKALVDLPGGYTTEFAWRDYNRDPDDVSFAVKWYVKDLQYAKEMVNGVHIKYLDDALASLKKATENGLEDKNYTVIKDF